MWSVECYALPDWPPRFRARWPAAGLVITSRRLAQGLGTFAAERLPTRPVGALLSFTEEMRSQGRDVETTLIKAAVEQPPDLAREALHLAVSAAAVTIQRVRIVDDARLSSR